MDRDTAVKMAQQAIKTKNTKLVDAVLNIKAEREQNPQPQKPMSEWPLIAVTCSTGWECYAIVEELAKTLKFRARALRRHHRDRSRAACARTVDTATATGRS